MLRLYKGGPFSVSLNYLKIMHQIPVCFDKVYLRNFFIQFFILRICCYIVMAIGPMLHSVAAILNNVNVNLSEDASFSLGASGAVTVTILYVLKFQEWNALFKDLTNISRYGKPKNFPKIIKRMNQQGNIIFIGSIWLTLLYGAASWYSTINCTSTIETCPTFSPFWLPFGAGNKRVGIPLFIFQYCVNVVNCQMFSIACFTMYESTEILIGHISHLKSLFRQVFDGSSAEARERLRFCIHYHIFILSLANRLNFLIKHTAGHMSLLSAIVCGVLTNQLMDTKPLGSVAFILGWLTSLFYFCHSGQRIKDKTSSIGNAVLGSKWYKANAQCMRDMQFVILRSQKPIYYEALPLGVLDYPFYLIMIKTGYSYFALFNQSM